MMMKVVDFDVGSFYIYKITIICVRFQFVGLICDFNLNVGVLRHSQAIKQWHNLVVFFK